METITGKERIMRKEMIGMTTARNGRVKFVDYFESVHEAGALDAKTKELLHIAVVLALRCEK